MLCIDARPPSDVDRCALSFFHEICGELSASVQYLPSAIDRILSPFELFVTPSWDFVPCQQGLPNEIPNHDHKHPKRLQHRTPSHNAPPVSIIHQGVRSRCCLLYIGTAGRPASTSHRCGVLRFRPLEESSESLLTLDGWTTAVRTPDEPRTIAGGL